MSALASAYKLSKMSRARTFQRDTKCAGEVGHDDVTRATRVWEFNQQKLTRHLSAKVLSSAGDVVRWIC